MYIMYIVCKDLLLNYVLYYVCVSIHAQMLHMCIYNTCMFFLLAGAVQIEPSPCFSEPDSWQAIWGIQSASAADPRLLVHYCLHGLLA